VFDVGSMQMRMFAVPLPYSTISKIPILKGQFLQLLFVPKYSANLRFYLIHTFFTPFIIVQETIFILKSLFWIIR